MKKYLFSIKPFFPDLSLLFLRVYISVLMIINHGLVKLENYNSASKTFFDPFGIGSPMALNLALFAELFCSLLVIIGFMTRVALIPLIITMVVAFFIFNVAEPMIKKELPLIFLLTYIAIFVLGPGRFSLDSMLFGAGKKTV